MIDTLSDSGPVHRLLAKEYADPGKQRMLFVAQRNFEMLKRNKMKIKF
jgi:hypothetical protein